MTAPLRWPRRVLLAALLLSPLALWPASTHFRLTVYQQVYPYLDDDRQVWILDRIQVDERRPDVSRRLYAIHDDDPAEAWSQVFRNCWTENPLVVWGLEDELIAVLSDPAMRAAHSDALRAVASARLVDPRLPKLLRPMLQDPDLAPAAARALILNGEREGLAPVLIRALKSPRRLTRDSQRIKEALVSLMELGPEAKAAVPAVRLRLSRRTMMPERTHALAALYAIEGRQSHARDLRLFLRSIRPLAKDDFPPARAIIVEVAAVMARVGLGDEEVRKVLEENLEAGEPRPADFEGFHELGAAGAPSLPLLAAFLDNEDPEIREAARRAMAAIEARRKKPEG